MGNLTRRLLWGAMTAAALAMSGLILLNIFSDAPKVAEGYYETVGATGVIERTYTALGPHAVAHEEHDSGDRAVGKIEVWYPKDLADDNSVFPLVVMANGTRIRASRYRPVFEHLASWGFIVAGNEANGSGSGHASALTLDFVLAQNDDPRSVLYRKVDKANIGAAGHSQGGNGTIRAVIRQANGGLYKAIFTASSMRNVNFGGRPLYDVRQIRIPYFMVAGDGLADQTFVAPLASLQANFKGLPDGVPAVMARRRNSGHSDMLKNADGYMTAWFRYWLAGDEAAGRAFIGPAPELSSNTANWRDVAIKNLP